jgi:Tol biopolymer transport system component
MKNKNNELDKIIIFLLIIGFVLACISCSPIKKYGLVFSAKIDNNQDIYSIPIDNPEDLTRLTYSPEESEENLLISNDGKKILYEVYGEDKGWNTYILNISTLESTELNYPNTGMVSIKPLSWGKQDDSIYLFSQQQKIVVKVNQITGEKYLLDIPKNNISSDIINFSFSSIGERVAYIANDMFTAASLEYPRVGLFIYDFDTKKGSSLPPIPYEVCFDPKWSPTGEELLLTCNLLNTIDENRETYIYLIKIEKNDLSNIEKISELPCGYQFYWGTRAKYAWSPTGEYFVTAYCEPEKDNSSLYIYKQSGEIERSFTVLGDEEKDWLIAELAWTPDNKNIVFIAGVSEYESDIFIINTDGTEKKKITTGQSNYKNIGFYNINN